MLGIGSCVSTTSSLRDAWKKVPQKKERALFTCQIESAMRSLLQASHMILKE